MTTVAFLLNATPSALLKTGGSELAPLLGPAARARLLRSASSIALPARTLCLECRLDDDERVDLALCLASHTIDLAPALESLGRCYADDARWQRCVRLLLSWERAQDSALASVPFLYTAFDLGSEARTMPVPCLSICADPSFFMRRLGLPVPRAPRGFVLRLLDACRVGLEADWLTPSLLAYVQRCLEAEVDLEVRQLSLMLSRQPVAVKLDVTVPLAELERFLLVTGWRGSAAALTSQLREIAPWQERVQLNYVVSGGHEQAPLEVELCCTGSAEPSAVERAQLLEKLVALGLVHPAKARALNELVKRPVVSDSTGRWVARNWYVKLRFEQGAFASAKAYIGLMQRSAGATLETPAQLAHGPGRGGDAAARDQPES
jgi:hypothetical protein